jgi:hypothetical protein
VVEDVKPRLRDLSVIRFGLSEFEVMTCAVLGVVSDGESMSGGEVVADAERDLRVAARSLDVGGDEALRPKGVYGDGGVILAAVAGKQKGGVAAVASEATFVDAALLRRPNGGAKNNFALKMASRAMKLIRRSRDRCW